jgi:hypothetical protein
VIFARSAAFDCQKASKNGCSRVSVSRSSIRVWLAPQRDAPLHHREIGHSRESDLAVAPGLGAGPLDQIVKVPRFFRSTVKRRPFRLPGATDVRTDDRIAAGDPVNRIRRLASRIGGGEFRLQATVGVRLGEISQHVLAIRAPAYERRGEPVVRRAEHVDQDLGSIAEFYWQIALDHYSLLDGLPVPRRMGAPRFRGANRLTVAIFE